MQSPQTTSMTWASVSKATGTLPAIMKAYDNGRIDLNKPMSKYFAPLRNTDKKSLTIKEALLHETGMPASLQMTSVIIDPNSFTKPLIKRRKSSILLHTNRE